MPKPLFLASDAYNKINQIHRELARKFGVYYLSYFCAVENIDVRFSHVSNASWENEYLGNNLVDHCHLYTTATRLINVPTVSNSFIMP